MKSLFRDHSSIEVGALAGESSVAHNLSTDEKIP